MNGTAPSGSEYELKNLQHSHREIIRLLALGHKYGAISKAVGVDYDTVVTIAQSEVTKQHLNRLQDEMDDQMKNVSFERMRELIETEAPASLEVVKQVRDGSGEFANVSPALRLQASKTLLGMAGHGEIRNIRGEVTHTDRISPADIRAIRAAVDADRIRERSENVINAEFEIEESTVDLSEPCVASMPLAVL